MDRKKASILRGAHRSIWTNIFRYSHDITSIKTNFFAYFLLSSTREVASQSYHIRRFGSNNMTGAIIPALMHRIPSKLRSEACLGKSSTRMGDLLGSPHVAPLLAFSDGISMIYVGISCVNRFRPCHFHLHQLIVDLIP